MLLLLSALCLADDQAREWETLYDARLIEAVDGTPEVAARFYEELLEDMPSNDPLRPQVFYWLGRTRLVLGQIEAALPPLREAALYPETEAQAQSLLRYIEAQRQQIARLPVRYDFEDGANVFVSPNGALSTTIEDTDRALLWSLMYREGDVHNMTLTCAAGLPVQKIGFQVRATSLPAYLQVTIVDPAGGRYSAPLQIVPVDGWVSVRLGREVFRSLDGGGNRPPTVVARVEIEDLTGYLSSDRGPNSVLVDDFWME